MPSHSQYWRDPNKYRKSAKRWADARRRHTRAIARALHQNRRRVIIAKYGGCCACCGEDTYEFLAIDHVKGGGCKERREKRFANSQSFYRYLDITRRLKRYQVLCHNCNSAKAFYGGCPHRKRVSLGRKKKATASHP